MPGRPWAALLLLALLLAALPAARPSNATAALAEVLTTCYDPNAIGPVVFQDNGEEFTPSPAMCLASRTQHGHVARAAAVAARLIRCEKGGGLQVTVFGGSVTCGHCLPDQKQSYIKLLEDALNRLFPCPRRHVVVNRCNSGSGTDWFINQMGRFMKGRGHFSLQNADMVIVETTMNDVIELLRSQKKQRSHGEDYIQECTEVLVRQLLLLPKRPLVLYLSAGWRRHSGPLSAPPYHWDAAHAHARVLSYYNIPQVSAWAALQPLYSPTRRDWLGRAYFCDEPGHPNVFGHRFVTTLLLYSLRRDLVLSQQLTTFDRFADDGAGLPPPLSDVKAVYEEMMRGAVFEYVDLRRGAGELLLANPSDSFQPFEDVPGKPGLIAQTVGATLLLNITRGLAPLQPNQPYLTTVGLLISYAHMGTAALSIVTLNNTGVDHVLHRTMMDCTTTEKVSIYQPVALPWTLAADAEMGVGLYVEVLSSDPARDENKVKLFDVTTVCAQLSS